MIIFDDKFSSLMKLIVYSFFVIHNYQKSQLLPRQTFLMFFKRKTNIMTLQLPNKLYLSTLF